MGIKELPVRELDFGNSTGFEPIPTETSCCSGNYARILVSKLSESGKTTFSEDRHDDASSKTRSGDVYYGEALAQQTWRFEWQSPVQHPEICPESYASTLSYRYMKYTTQ
ncbi:hypothetical protein SLEP1_g35334 [Rubroshorea leprosula]|uniref:Uncharacterized protein n=1 Tax=Rubroshorea leprosula TaxID=152421 RepID=A0AAV5KNC9_9ROSI|nr:hypothetical protein SLEP1_g35334 [Rubroshorea leprosula]